MKQRAAVLVVLFCLFASVCTEAQSAFTGTWQGKLYFNGMGLTLVLHLKETEGKLTGSIDSPDQGATGIAADAVTVTGAEVLITVNAIGGYYKAKINAGNDTLTGKWVQGGMSLPLTLGRTDKPTVMARTQVPVPPFPYTEEEAVITTPTAGVTLAGTFTIPKEGTGPFPAVVLVSGSGPQNRDEELMGHKPFQVLADYLSRNGIAVLRYDDRGTAKSTGDFTTGTTTDYSNDAEAAFTWLLARKEVDAKRCGIAGHSEGGLIAPLVAARNPRVAFIVLLAGPGINGEKIIHAQSALIARAQGTPEADIQRDDQMLAKAFALLKSGKDSAMLAQGAAVLTEEIIAALPEGEKKDSQMVRQQLTMQWKQMQTPWFREFITLEPAIALQKVTCAVLALNGTKDLQVPYEMNLEAIRDALTNGGNTKFTIRAMDNLNHLFQRCTTGAPAEYATIAETMNAELLQAVAGWIAAQR